MEISQSPGYENSKGYENMRTGPYQKYFTIQNEKKLQTKKNTIKIRHE